MSAHPLFKSQAGRLISPLANAPNKSIDNQSLHSPGAS
jgi:hypothetical protein